MKKIPSYDLKIIEKFSKEFRFALKIRLLEQKLLKLFNEGEVAGTIHTSIGQEIIPVMLYRYLKSEDWVLSNHRCHAHFLAKTNNFYGLLAEVLGRESGASSGIGGSQHLHADFFMSNGIQGGMTPIAAGIGLGNKLKNNSNIAVCHIGDGTLGEGILYESLNFLGLWQLPVLLVLEDNGISQSTPTSTTISGSIPDRFTSFGIEYFFCDSSDWTSLDAISKKAVETVRRGHPCVLHVKANRLMSHSKGDDNRPLSVVSAIEKLDPIASIMDSGDYVDLMTELRLEIDGYVDQVKLDKLAHTSPKWDPIIRKPVIFRGGVSTSDKAVRDQIRDGLSKWLTNSHSSFILGEDIQYKAADEYLPYGGAFKVTGNLSELYPERVKNTPISEAAMMGVGTGLALNRCQSSVEIMFGDFTTLIIDQLLQHACKFKSMYGTEIPLPVNVRTPMGGRRGYGATHSQSIERLFVGIPELITVSPNHRLNISDFYTSVLSLQSPTFIAEHKLVYNLTSSLNLEGYDMLTSDEVLPTVLIRPSGEEPQFTIFTYGYGLFLAEKAIHELSASGIWCEIVCPSALSPLNIDPLIRSLLKTSRFIGFEEGSGKHGVSSACLAYLYENRIQLSYAKIIGNDSYVPASSVAENHCLPSQELLVKTILESI